MDLGCFQHSHTLHSGKTGKSLWLPNGRFKLLPPEGPMDGSQRQQLLLRLPSDNRDSSQESSCPYRVARKYLKQSGLGPSPSKGPLREFWGEKKTRSEERADEASEGGAVVFVCSDGIFSAITYRTSLLLVLLCNADTEEFCWVKSATWGPIAPAQ